MSTERARVPGSATRRAPSTNIGGSTFPAPELCLGAPRFQHPHLAALAEREGLPAAWAAALEHEPLRAVADVQGPFAVAVRRPGGGAFLAIDRFGVESLCYRIVDKELRFASRADELADSSAELDAQAIYDYLYFHTIPSPRTIFKGVYRLPPGHCASWEGGRLTVEPYWAPEFTEPHDARFDELRDRFRELLRGAVFRLLANGRPACFLSGGTDSSTIAGLIGEVSGTRASTYSIGFDAAGYDEMAYARLAARHFGTDHHEYYVTPADVVRSIPELAASYDQPFGNSSVLPAYYCARLAKEDGVHRLLAGDGGDELFGGNARYAKQRIFDWYGHVPEALRDKVVEPLFGLPGVARAPLLRKGASYIQQARVPMPDRHEMYNLLLRLGPGEVLEPGFLAQVDMEAPIRQQRQVWAAVRAVHAINRTLAYDWRYTLAESDLPKVVGATRLAGLDVAFPFLDQDLVDFSLGLPPGYKLKGVKLRWFFKEALRGFLPDEILRKRKHGFGLPFGHWTLRDDALRALARDSLASVADRGIVRRQFIGRLTDNLLPAHPGYYGEMVWILMTLEQWLRSHASTCRLAP